MKTAIYYFTGTGNSLEIARRIAETICGSEVLSIAACMRHNRLKTDAERVGFVFPVYYLGLPKIVERFLRALDLGTVLQVFYVNTSGGDSGFDSSTLAVGRILARKGKKLSDGYNIVMPDNYVKMYEPEAEEEQKVKLQAGEKSAEEIARNVISGKGEIKKDKMGRFSRIVNRFWQVFLAGGSDRAFFVSSDCNFCGLCSKVCPVENIRMKDGKPEWQHHCEECMACIHFCPKAAIQTKKAVNRARYHHPGVKAADLMEWKRNS